METMALGCRERAYSGVPLTERFQAAPDQPESREVG